MTITPKVALIVRTKNRPIFIKRAIFESILPQTFQDYKVYVINDGGDVNDIEALKASIPLEFAEKFVFVHLPFSLGSGGALAAGISHTSEKYLHIHDDDDSLKPEFLEKTVAYLENDTKLIFSGVKTSNYDVYEHIDGGKIITDLVSDKAGLDRDIIKDYISVVSHMALVSAITVLFRRECIDKVGSSDQRRNFGEDSDLYARLMQWGEIGVIKDFLCSYHHNRRSDHNSFENSMPEKPYDQTVQERNNLIREALNIGDRAKLFQANVWRNHHASQAQFTPVYEQIRLLKKNFDAVTENIKSILQ